MSTRHPETRCPESNTVDANCQSFEVGKLAGCLGLLTVKVEMGLAYSALKQMFKKKPTRFIYLFIYLL